MEEFKLIDDDRVPGVIKPMVILHDKLVNGYNNDKNIKLDKLIRSLEKGLGEQVVELVKMEDASKKNAIMLSASLDVMRDLVNTSSVKDMHSIILKYVQETADKLGKSV